MSLFTSVFDSGNTNASLSYIKKRSNGVIEGPFFVHDDNQKYTRQSNNYFVQDNELSIIITGTTEVVEKNRILDEGVKNLINSNFSDRIKTKFRQNAFTYVFFKEKLIDDFFIDIGINRNYNTLDTLDVKNVLIGEIPQKTSATGVVFGKLEAIQKINDGDGNKIVIPLANVPVSIFNASDEFPDITSTDEDGNRITLNLKENSKREEYFNEQSYLIDKSLLKNDESSREIPDKFKYTTITNKNGEFIIFDVPVGPQTFMFEVDLLKQGLTKDEVALNFFPYPTNDDPIVDTIPHLFFRQFSINVYPSWGDSNTGYTEMNIKIPLDLKKWATYYVPPFSFGNTPVEKLAAVGVDQPLKILIRDMTNLHDENLVEIVEISNVLNRNETQELEWFNEIKQRKNRADIFKSDHQVIKLPANLYDPAGNKTDDFGNPTGSAGVWLCAYQFKITFGNENAYRVTSFEKRFLSNNVATGTSHFDLNKTSSPYERSWTIDYPEKYYIPKFPINPNPNYPGNKGFDQYGFPIDRQTKWADGEIIGYNYTPGEVAGYGLQSSVDTGIWIKNNFSKKVTKNLIYKYEDDGYYSSTLSWGKTPPYGSRVINGEKYQRVEAGYGYWLRPHGFPIILHGQWTDIIDRGDTLNKISNKEISVFNENITLRLDNNNPYPQENLSIYRIVDPSPQNLAPPELIVIDKYIKIWFGSIYVNNNLFGGKRDSEVMWFEPLNDHTTLDDYGNTTKSGFVPFDNTGSYKDNIKIVITSQGDFAGGIHKVGIDGAKTEIKAGETKEIKLSELSTSGGLTLVFLGNSDLAIDSINGSLSYSRAKYSISFKVEPAPSPFNVLYKRIDFLAGSANEINESTSNNSGEYKKAYAVRTLNNLFLFTERDGSLSCTLTTGRKSGFNSLNNTIVPATMIGYSFMELAFVRYSVPDILSWSVETHHCSSPIEYQANEGGHHFNDRF